MKIKIGKKVKIVNRDKVYSTYDKMFKLLNFSNTKVNKYIKGYKSLVWEVVNITIHEDGYTNLAFIKSGDKELLIAFDGIKVQNKKVTQKECKKEQDEIIDSIMDVVFTTQD